MANLLFASRAPNAQHAAERSLYFRGGRRLRLLHDAGPSVGRHTMDRYTFRHNAQANREFNEDDYDAAMRIADAGQRRNRLDAILAPVAEGGHGRLFEIEHGQYGDPRAGTHGSRGGVAPHGIDGEARLQRLVQIAQAGRNQLPPLETAWEDARSARRTARHRYRQADTDMRNCERRLRMRQHAVDAANAPHGAAQGAAAGQQPDLARAQRELGIAQTRLAEARERRRAMRARFHAAERVERAADEAYRARRDQLNALVRAEFGG